MEEVYIKYSDNRRFVKYLLELQTDTHRLNPLHNKALR